MKRTRNLGLLSLMSLLVLTACGQTGPIDTASATPWEHLVIFFAKMIDSLSLGGVTGVGIILFTLLIRLVLLPLYQVQIKSSQKMQALQPQLRAIQAKYPERTSDNRLKLAEETQALYKEAGVNPLASLWPLLVQMPVLLALFQALTRVDALKTGHFLWMDIAQPDPYFILPILAALLTYASTWLTNKANAEQNGVMTAMTYLMPLLIFLIGIGMASGVALYWTVSNAFQVGQLLVLNNPFKVIAERQEAQRLVKEREAKIRRAKKKANKRK